MDCVCVVCVLCVVREIFIYIMYILMNWEGPLHKEALRRQTAYERVNVCLNHQRARIGVHWEMYAPQGADGMARCMCIGIVDYL